ncbi:sulfur reduction protein DsrE [Brumimicrobium oceani]|uniref:Sulfur reduction protein DsrE n=1 Tax=Brumimicrobium oceani TaxID=2100725 RepID=A0A2U2X0P9_9FLAO|nr:sulfur reduction protein DsrE [Brumimicrobium oceani]PWH81353.1 sulfur reduction protein DsrE [Brumimicrobium oceani]
MKNIITIITLALVFVFAQTAVAQNLDSIDTNKKNYIVLTKKVGQLKPISLAADEMKKEDGADFGEFHVVFCGKNIDDLTDKKRMVKHLERLNKSGVKLIACGFSLKKFDVNPEKLPEGIEIVDNGIAYGLKLKKKGFYGMEL